MNNNDFQVFLNSWGVSAPVDEKTRRSWGYVSYESLMKVIEAKPAQPLRQALEKTDPLPKDSEEDGGAATTLAIMNDADLMGSFERGVRDSKSGQMLSMEEVEEAVAKKRTKRRRTPRDKGVLLTQ